MSGTLLLICALNQCDFNRLLVAGRSSSMAEVVPPPPVPVGRPPRVSNITRRLSLVETWQMAVEKPLPQPQPQPVPAPNHWYGRFVDTSHLPLPSSASDSTPVRLIVCVILVSFCNMSCLFVQRSSDSSSTEIKDMDLVKRRTDSVSSGSSTLFCCYIHAILQF